MAQNQELQDFSSSNSLEEKENFIKDIIQKQVDLAHMSVAAFSTNIILLNHLHLMRNINDSKNDENKKVIFDLLIDDKKQREFHRK